MNSNYTFVFEDATINTLMISYRKFTEPVSVHTHGRDTYEIHYVTEGNGSVVLGGKTYPVKKGVFYLAGPNAEHEQTPFTHDSVTEFGCFFHIKKSSSQTPLLDILNRHKTFITKSSREMDRIVYGILYEQDQHMHASDRKITLLLEELLIECIRMMAPQFHHHRGMFKPVPENNFHKSNLTQQNINLIVDEIFLLEYATITLDDLADIIGLSNRQTQRFLQKYYNKSFLEKRLEARMSAAKTFLKRSDMSITQISEKIGYSSIEHFSAVFKKIYGISPSEYRKNSLI